MESCSARYVSLSMIPFTWYGLKANDFPDSSTTEVWHINSGHAPLNRDDGGLPADAYLHLARKKEAN